MFGGWYDRSADSAQVYRWVVVCGTERTEFAGFQAAADFLRDELWWVGMEGSEPAFTAWNEVRKWTLTHPVYRKITIGDTEYDLVGEETE